MRFPYDTHYADQPKILRFGSERAAYALLAAVLIALPFLLPRFYTGEIAYLFILAIASLGLMLLTGFTGQVSLGHSAFLAIGAYTHARLLTLGLPLLPSMLCAGALSAAAGAAIGMPAIRVSGLHLAMVTLAFAIVVEHIIGRWSAVTGGHTGMAVPSPSLAGFDLGAPVPFYFLCLAVLALALLGLVNLTRGRSGRAFTGLRDSEAAAAGLGIWIAGYKVLAFAVSAFIAGLAGALMAHKVQYLTPDGFGLILSMELVLMVVIGGLGSLRGAILGAILIGMLPTAISKLKPLLPQALGAQFGLEMFLTGLILALFVLFEPGGLNARWLKLRALFTAFPLYRRDTYRRPRAYMKSERYR